MWRNEVKAVFSCVVMLLLLASSSSAVSVPEDAKYCYDCHSNLREAKFSYPAYEWTEGIHMKRGVTCEDCHGVFHTTKRKTMSDLDYVEVCTECHRGAASGHQFSRWRISKHAQAYATLWSEEAKQIARLSGIPEEPQEAAMCLGCHATASEAEASKMPCPPLIWTFPSSATLVPPCT